MTHILVIVLVVFIFAAFKWPKPVLTTSGVLIALLVCGLGTFQLNDYLKQRKISHVNIKIFPNYEHKSLGVYAQNNTRSTINKISFRISIKRNGYSNDLNSNRSYHDDFKSYKIINPSNQYEYLGNIIDTITPQWCIDEKEKLTYVAENVHIIFDSYTKPNTSKKEKQNVSNLSQEEEEELIILKAEVAAEEEKRKIGLTKKEEEELAILEIKQAKSKELKK